MPNNNYALSPVVALSFTVTIVVSAVGIVFIYGLPYVEKLENKAALEDVVTQFSVASYSIEDGIRNDIPNSTRIYNFDILEDASVNINPIGKRFIISYSLDKDFNFTVSGLDDEDKVFFIKFLEGVPVSPVKTSVYWFYDKHSKSKKIKVDLTTLPSDEILILDSPNVEFDWANFVVEGDLTSYKLDPFPGLWSTWSSSINKTFWSLPDGDYTFEVKKKDSEEDYLEKHFEVVEGSYEVEEDIVGVNNENTWEFTCNPLEEWPWNGLNGTVRIYLYHDDPKTLIGKVFLFDLGSISYTRSSDSGDFVAIYENNGIISIDPDGERVRKGPLTSFEPPESVAEGMWWPMFHNTPSHLGYSAVESPETNYVKWKVMGDKDVGDGPLAVANGYVYNFWESSTSGESSSPKLFLSGFGVPMGLIGLPGGGDPAPPGGGGDPAIPGGNPPSFRQWLFCHDAETGEFQWGKEIEQPPEGAVPAMVGWKPDDKGIRYPSAAVSGGRVYVPAVSDVYRFYCLNAYNGEEHWSKVLTGYTSSPAVSEGSVYFSCTDGYIYCYPDSKYEPEDEDIWKYKIQEPTYTITAPAVYDNRVYVCGEEEGAGWNVYCFPSYGGDEYIWKYQIDDGGDRLSSPAIADGRVYILSNSGILYCLRAKDSLEGGEERMIWPEPPSLNVGDYPSTPTIAYDKVYIGAVDGVHWYKAEGETAVKLGSITDVGEVRPSPVVADKKIYFGSATDQKFYCCDAVTGETIWKYPDIGHPQYPFDDFKVAYSTSPAISDGKAYVGGRRDELYCFEDLPEYKNTLAFRIVQIRDKGESTNTGTGSFHVNVEFEENFFRELLKEAFHLKIYMYGENSGLWLNYFKQLHDFIELPEDPTGHTLTQTGYISSEVLIAQSICSVEFS